MAAVEFFTNAIGVEPKMYTKYIKRKPMRQASRTIKQTRSSRAFDDAIREGSVAKA